MAVPHGSGSVLSIDGNAWTSYCDSQSLDKVRDLAETSVFGTTDKTYVSGLRGHTIQIGGPWDPTLDGYADTADDGATVLFELGPEGGTAGDVKYSGSCLISGYSWQSSASAVPTWTASFTVTGAVTRGTY